MRLLTGEGQLQREGRLAKRKGRGKRIATGEASYRGRPCSYRDKGGCLKGRIDGRG